MTRAPGRPRSEEADRAILDAALETVAERGFEGTSVEEIAERAGVGKATIYRRYSCKADLVLAAVQTLAARRAPVPDTGTVAGDLRGVAHGVVDLLGATPLGPLMRVLEAEMDRQPDLREVHDRFIAQRRQGMRAVVERAVARGELRPDTDPELLSDLLVGPIKQRHLVTGRPPSATYVDAVADAVVRAFAADAAAVSPA